MADRAIGDPLFLHMVLLDQKRTEHGLLGLAWLPMQVEYLLAWPDIALRRTVAGEAPLHLKRLSAPCQGHLIDLTVT